VQGYYEWQKSADGKTKQPYFVHSGDGSLITFAGLYEWWKDPAKEDGAPDAWLLSCSIVTMASPPDGELATLHDRLPVPLSPGGLAEWLEPENKDAAPLLEAVLAEAWDLAAGWVLDPVSTAVGNVRNDSPDLIQPLTL
jgi:putative SOS response-associated peptidase YedK